MKLTIEQALQQGVEAHKQGKIQDAERLYRAILQTQPAHPDANHNLGLLAVSVNKADASLPLFEIALKANPKIEQFWLSYIDALIKEKQFGKAKQVLEQAKNQSVAGEKLNIFEIQLTSIAQVNTHKLAVQKKVKKQNLNAVSPSEAEIKSLLEYCQNGQYGDAEKLAVAMTKRFPSHQFCWKVLGAVLENTGRINESLAASQKSVQLAPQDAEASNNLGNILQKVGRLNEAKVSYTKAIALEPGYASAHYNLGVALQKLRRLDEAEQSFTQAIVLKPDYAEAHNNLGGTLEELGRLEEAEVSFKQSIVLKPDYAQAHNNLGGALKQLGRLEEAEASYKQAVVLKPNFAEAHTNLGNMLKELGRLEEAEARYKQALELKPNSAEALMLLGIKAMAVGCLEDAEARFKQSLQLNPNSSGAHLKLGNILLQSARLGEAEASFRSAIALQPEDHIAHNSLGRTLRSLGRFGEAEVSFRQAVVLKPDYAVGKDSLLYCLYIQDKPSAFFDQLDYFILQDHVSAVMGSLTERSAIKYGSKRPNLFCETPLEYVSHTDLNAQCDFAEIFIEPIRNILNEKKIAGRTQSLLVNGYQSFGNLFTYSDLTEKIEKFIRLELEKYRINFKSCEEGLIEKWPTEYILNGWLISMKSGGELLPHIHGAGWISGSVYINVPSKLKSDSGALVVSPAEAQDERATRRNIEKTIDVATGSLVFFPSSLTHYTIPFESKEERIVLAFDMVPSRKT